MSTSAPTGRVRVVSSDEWEAHRRDRFRDPPLVRAEPWFKWVKYSGRDSVSAFMWECPGCGGAYLGDLGDQPVGGWEAPRWVNSGTLEAPTLQPSLGCGAWHRGECPDGHWWMRDGVLVPA